MVFRMKKMEEKNICMRRRKNDYQKLILAFFFRQNKIRS